MTQASSVPNHPEIHAAGPGRIVLVVGPSGAGKDTLIALARSACEGDNTVVFPKRIVTRPPSTAEDNAHMDAVSFAHATARGDFAVHWHAHGLSYGLPRSIIDDVRAGRVVIANVSRTVIASIRALFENVVVVMVTAPALVLAQRLAARRRASDGAISERLSRDVTVEPADITINNVGPADQHAEELLAIIRTADDVAATPL